MKNRVKYISFILFSVLSFGMFLATSLAMQPSAGLDNANSSDLHLQYMVKKLVQQMQNVPEYLIPLLIIELQ